MENKLETSILDLLLRHAAQNSQKGLIGAFSPHSHCPQKGCLNEGANICDSYYLLWLVLQGGNDPMKEFELQSVPGCMEIKHTWTLKNRPPQRRLSFEKAHHGLYLYLVPNIEDKMVN